MKVKVNRKELENKLDKFRTNGRLTYSSKKKDMIPEAKAYIFDDKLWFSGTFPRNQVIMCRTSIDVKDAEEGEFDIGNVPEFKKFIGNLSSKEITIKSDGSQLIITDEKSSLSIPSSSVKDTKNQIKGFISGVEVLDDKVSLGKLELSPLMVIRNPKQWKDLEKLNYNVVKTKFYDITIKDGVLTISLENSQKRKSYESSDFDVKTFGDKELRIYCIDSILNNIEGETKVFHAETSKGNQRIIFNDGDTTWLVKVNKIRK